MNEISRMSSAERLATMELLWESFANEGIDYPSPDWHEPLLSTRSELIASDKAVWLTVDDLQARLSSR